ncbi:gluconate 2-dehydrogenase subunit 3 family protein [Arenibacter sp. GZD96]|uniref:gluconate 2-dehydrogenase subunit 3 family protein n=1 Tax=Aurantibrevibacter litoralis TaxID=3106030 RepID=UPI002AFE0027|nr:gluconate 2-dehydrogenase subunit 3 family protein [Arenibacter sp. GZD-96]MEA1786603.1 gluconate 2-dehydrogenase subunit 3 family protein [Arenibacter sp. GZD-96]
MERRIALKNMGLSLGYIVATPTIIGLVQSCKNEKVLEWTPDFFSQEEGAMLTHLVDIILPKTDTPAASELQVHLFIDRFANEVLDQNQQDLLRLSTSKFVEKALKDSGKTKVADLEVADLEPVLAATLKVTKEDEKVYLETINTYNKAVKNGESAQLNDVVSQFAFANDLRKLAIWGYKTSEFVGEEVLAYLPVPGEFVACGDLQELTAGKAWSLG